MYEIYLGAFTACVFSSGFLVGAVVGAKGAEKRAVTKIAVAKSRAEESDKFYRWAMKAIDHKNDILRKLRAELADRPAPRKRDANGRFVK